MSGPEARDRGTGLEAAGLEAARQDRARAESPATAEQGSRALAAAQAPQASETLQAPEAPESAAALHLLTAAVRPDRPDRARFREAALLLGVPEHDLGRLTEQLAHTREEVAGLRDRSRELRAVADSARVLADATSVDETLAYLVDAAHGIVEADIAYLSEYFPGTRELRVRASRGVTQPDFARLPVPTGIGLASRIARSKRPQAVVDYFTEPGLVRSAEMDDVVGREGVVSLLGVPLLGGPASREPHLPQHTAAVPDGSGVLGVLFVGTRRRHEYSPEEIAVLSALADHAAIALLRSVRLSDLRRHGDAAAAEASAWEHHFREQRRMLDAVDGLFEAVLGGAEVHEVLGALAESTDRRLVLHDESGRVLADSCASGPASAQSAAAALPPAAAAKRSAGVRAEHTGAAGAELPAEAGTERSAAAGTGDGPPGLVLTPDSADTEAVVTVEVRRLGRLRLRVLRAGGSGGARGTDSAGDSDGVGGTDAAGGAPGPDAAGGADSPDSPAGDGLSADGLDAETLVHGAQICGFAWLLESAGRLEEDRRRDRLLSQLLSGTHEAAAEAEAGLARAGMPAGQVTDVFLLRGDAGDLRRIGTAFAAAGFAGGAAPGTGRRPSRSTGTAPASGGTVSGANRQERGTGGFFQGMYGGELCILTSAETAGRAVVVLARQLTATPGVSAVHTRTAEHRTPHSGRSGLVRAHRRCTELLGVVDALDWTGELVELSELQPYARLFGADRASLEAFADAVLGPVLDADAQAERGSGGHRAAGVRGGGPAPGGLLALLEAYFRSGRNLRATAEATRFHVNTVAQRLQRVDGLLGPEWRNADRLFLVEAAVRLAAMDRRLHRGRGRAALSADR
ncbi:helix-turn-helix domain-containing protein [Brevibacterium album]|uniref:helix-turn-helix domain-containing protein n=1 Tax=Brevibacterium album TaxID=417948 RepID=UPI000416C90D|nr:helix-turn-helix domain-containing protein [Brevibacterium album]